MTRKQLIEAFLADKRFAAAGISRDPRKFGGSVFRDLTAKGFTIYPINPNAEKIDGQACYPDVLSIPDEVKKLLVITSKSETDAVMDQAVRKGIKQVWIQQMSETPEAIKLAQENGMDLITKECIYMYAEPVKGVHRFHRFLKNLFSR